MGAFCRTLIRLFFVFIFVTHFITEAKKCGRTPVNITTQGCCFGKVYDKIQGGVSYSCCPDANRLYKTYEEECCGNQVRHKHDIKDLVCCEHHFRPKDKGLCCKGVYYEQANRRTDRCCEDKLKKGGQKECCNGVVHDKIPRGKCCGTKYYNKTFQWCKNKRKEEVLPLDEDICYAKRYKKKNHLCCYGEKKIKEKVDKLDDQCCGLTTYNSKENYCINETRVVSKEEYDNRKISMKCGQTEIDGHKIKCCNGMKPFDPNNEHCCGGQVISISEKCCDGRKLDTAMYTCCKSEQREHQAKKSDPTHDKCCFLGNGSTQTYNSIKSECSLFYSRVIPRIKRCGLDTLNDSDICCGGVLVENGKVLNMACCGRKPYHLYNETCKDGVIRNKTSFNKRTYQGPMCGLKPYNRSKDLCCSGKFVKDGVFLKMKCCGVKPYFTQNTTCDTSLQLTSSRHKEEPACPSYCQKRLVTDVQNLLASINNTQICRLKIYKIKRKPDKTWRRGNRIVRFEEDCTCGNSTERFLIARKLTKKGNIKGPFSLLPVIRRFKRKFRQLKRENGCKTRKQKSKSKGRSGKRKTRHF